MNDYVQSSSANPPAGPTPKRTVFQLLSIFMIGNFLWRTFKPGYEWPMRFEQVITIAFDLLCLGSLIGLKIQISRAMPSSQSAWTERERAVLDSAGGGFGRAGYPFARRCQLVDRALL